MPYFIYLFIVFYLIFFVVIKLYYKRIFRVLVLDKLELVAKTRAHLLANMGWISARALFPWITMVPLCWWTWEVWNWDIEMLNSLLQKFTTLNFEFYFILFCFPISFYFINIIFIILLLVYFSAIQIENSSHHIDFAKKYNHANNIV
jgi:hypothetical protein